MLMSKSRLEKFLYALYSLDSSDLPTPLSRIEELYKCLVTRDETPTFEPLSRVEKYLMAILGGYDVELLPNPLSRVEVLLHKLATGDDNLDDVKSFLSEHEELLAEIIRNGGVGGNIDIEYVLYTLSTEFNTLYNTAEKPVKSAILKGNTLVNLHKLEKYSVYGVVLDGGINQHFGSDTLYATWRMYDISMLKPDTEYGVFCWVLENTLSEKPWYGHYYHSSDTVFNASTELDFSAGETGLKFAKLTTISDFTGKTCGIRHLLNANTPSSEYVKFRCVIVEYQEGMENWDIPYFEGMQSVKMPVLTTRGKNLFDGAYNKGKYFSSNGTERDSVDWATTTNFILAKPSTTYTQNIGKNSAIAYVVFYDKQKNVIATTSETTNFWCTYTTPSNCYFIKTCFKYGNEIEPYQFQVEEGLVTTEYEPYKSNILTVNEEVELGSVGDVKDELNLLTRELTQRTGEVVLDGSENWTRSAHAADSPMFYTPLNDLVHKDDYLNSINCDKLKVHTNEHNLYFYSDSPNGISAYADRTDAYPNENWIYIKYTDSEGSVENLKQWLSQNPVTVQYELATESIKTVDLSVVNQDGNNTKLSTFNDITHVTLSSEGLIPEAELEVATKNEEVLNTMSFEMDDISTTQNALQETSNTQSENVDATMLATTEIYEGLL